MATKKTSTRTPPSNSTAGALVLPSVQRTGIRWTPGLIRLAKIRAALGDYSLAGDLVQDLLADDDRVCGVMSVRVAAILGADLSFDHGSGRSKGQPVKALEAREDWWAMLPTPELVLLLWWGFLFGIGVGQLVYRDDNGQLLTRDGRITPRLDVWSPRHLRYDYFRRGWVLNLSGKEIPITPGDGEWILFCPYGSTDPTSIAPWRQISVLSLQRAYSILDSGRLGEVATILVASGPPGAKIGNENRDALAAELRKLGRDASVVLEGGLGLTNLSRESAHKIYESQWNHCETSIAIRLIGQNLTTEVKGGSFAAASAQELVRQDIKEFDADNASTMLHDQVLVPWSALNWGDAALAPWPVWAVKPQKNKLLLAQTALAQIAVIEKARALSDRVDVDKMLGEVDGVELLRVTPSTSVAVDPAALSAPAAPAPTQAPADNASP